MSERALLEGVLAALVALAAVTFAVLLRVPAPYGRHARRGFGPTVDGTAGWVLMEATAAVVPLATYCAGPAPGAVAWVFLAIWEVHYLYRAFVYPFRRRSAVELPAVVVVLGVVFNLLNGWANAAWLSHLGPARDAGWLAGPRFLGGLALFAAGLAVNLHSDEVLRALRGRGGAGYVVPDRGLHRLVASPNYLGELLEWTGFAILSWSPAAAVFALWTAANLVPRAVAHLRWYRRTFPEYPRERRALIPYLL